MYELFERTPATKKMVILRRADHAHFMDQVEQLHESRWIDTLALARVRFPGMHNSLDALCKRFKISLSEREKHGALVDAKFLFRTRDGAFMRVEYATPMKASLRDRNRVAAA